MTRLASLVVVAAGVLLAAVLLRAAERPEGEKPIDASCYGPDIQPGHPCPGEGTDPQAAINDPTSYAWRVFAEINQPAFPDKKSDMRRVWETWKSADDNSNPAEAIYLNNGHEPQKWDVRPRATPAPKRLVPIQQLKFLREQSRGPGHFAVEFVPTNPLAEEVRVNRPAFNFILEKKLYNRQGQYQYASAHPNFDFPLASKEVKAVWLEAPAGAKPTDYYSATVNGKTYVLVAMHVITKDLPFWFWSSFVHRDQNKDPKSGYVAPLASVQDAPKSLKGTPFENYRLLAELVQSGSTLVPSGKGAQVDWITRTGLATVMGNPHIEKGFETKSSCITFHAHASIGTTRDGTVQYNGFPVEVGAVSQKDFIDKDGVIYYPLDFVWSLRQAKNYQP